MTQEEKIELIEDFVEGLNKYHIDEWSYLEMIDHLAVWGVKIVPDETGEMSRLYFKIIKQMVNNNPNLINNGNK